MLETSIIEISKSAYRSNIKFLREQVGKHAVISSVVKGNAYGHGIENIVQLAEETGIRHFSTFSTDEAYRVFMSSKKKSQIMIMGMLDNSSLPWVIQNGISFYVFELDRLLAALQEARKSRKKAKIHIEVETGFHRTGFEWKEREHLLTLIQQNETHLELSGLCTHFAGAESINNYVRIQEQIRNFELFRNFFAEKNIVFTSYHTACSAA